jgi:hypothetical protein
VSRTSTVEVDTSNTDLDETDVVSDPQRFLDWLRPVFEGRKVILAGAPVAAWTPTVRTVRRLGAEAVFVLGTEGTGTGELPKVDEAEWLALDASGPTMMQAIRAGHALLADLPTPAREALDQFDPTGEALVVGFFLHELPEVAGRPSLAYRRPAWVALEDKLVADDIWDRAEVARAPAEVVDARGRALTGAARRLDLGSGTVWAGDAREGFHGSGEYVRWVRKREEAEEAAAFFVAHCDRVRVMPFLEGIPCSIHGVVLPDAVLALRPIEMITLRRLTAPTSQLF